MGAPEGDELRVFFYPHAVLDGFDVLSAEFAQHVRRLKFHPDA
jgi:hypothetical protein